MRLFIQFLTVLLGGLGLGYCSADYAMTSGLRTVTVDSGPWRTWPAVAQPTADPYTKAHFARTGKLALTSFEAITFRAENDDAGQPLDGSCDYTISSGRPAPARLWSIALYGRDGQPVRKEIGQSSFNSINTIRNTDGGFAIAVSDRISAGNWLPAENGESFILLFRIYNADQALASDPTEAALPRIARGDCR